jgi:hypothetical protein
MKDGYSKYDWISWILLFGWMGCTVLWLFFSNIFVFLAIVFFVGDLAFHSWDNKRKVKLFAERMSECSDTFNEAMKLLDDKLKEEEDEVH